MEKKIETKKKTKAISFMERPLVERDEEWRRQILAAIILRSASIPDISKFSEEIWLFLVD